MEPKLQSFTEDGRFLMLALDHRESIRQILNPLKPEAVTSAEIIKIKSEIIEALSSQFSGLLIDVEYGLPAYKSFDFAQDKPYLLAIEKTSYRDVHGERVTEIEHSVSELKQRGASGIKLLLYFHPEAKTSDIQLQTAKQILIDCFNSGLPLFLEIVTYELPGKEQSASELIIDSVRTFLQEKIIPQVFKLEYPGNSHACDEVTRLLGATPWILLTKGEDYELFKSQLNDALIHGASGFLAGRALWQEIGRYQNEAERKKFLETTVKQRFSEIITIARKKSFLV